MAYVPYKFVTHTVTGSSAITEPDFSGGIKPLKNLVYTPDNAVTRLHVESIQNGVFSGVAVGFTETAGTNEMTYISSSSVSGSPSVPAAAASFLLTGTETLVEFNTEIDPTPMYVEDTVTGVTFAPTSVAMDNSGYSYSASTLSGDLKMTEISPTGAKTVLTMTGASLTDTLINIFPVSRTNVIICLQTAGHLLTFFSATRATTDDNFVKAALGHTGTVGAADEAITPNRIIMYENTYIMWTYKNNASSYPSLGILDISDNTVFAASLVDDSINTIIGITSANDTLGGTMPYVAIDTNGVGIDMYAITLATGTYTAEKTSTTLPAGYTQVTDYQTLAGDDTSLYVMGTSATDYQMLRQTPGDLVWVLHGTISGLDSVYTGLTSMQNDFSNSFAAFKFTGTSGEVVILNVTSGGTIEQYTPPLQPALVTLSANSYMLNQTGTTSFTTWSTTEATTMYYIPRVQTALTSTHVSPTPGSGLSSSTIAWIVVGSILGAALLAIIIYYSVKAVKGN